MMGLFKVTDLFDHVLGMNGLSDLLEMRRSLSVGYGVNYVTLTFDLAHDVDLRFFKVKF